MKHYKPSGGKAKKRLLALVLALALICSSLMSVYANGVATMDDDFFVDDGFGMDDDFGVDLQMDDDYGVDEEPDWMSHADGITEKKDSLGNIVYEYGKDTIFDWTGDDVIASPYPDGEQMDPGFAIPTITYRFWLSEKDDAALEAFNEEVASGVELYGMTEAEYIDLYGPNDGMFSAVHIADGGSLWDNSFKNPTAADAPNAGKPNFAGWYTVDEYGYQRKFTFDANCDQTYVEAGVVHTGESATVDVFARWSANATDTASQPVTNPKFDDTLDDHTYDKWYAALVSSSDSAFQGLLEKYTDDEGFCEYLDNLPEDEIKYLSEKIEATAETIPGNRTVDITQGASSTIKVFESNSRSSITKLEYKCSQTGITAEATSDKKGYTITVNDTVPEGKYTITVTYTYTYYEYDSRRHDFIEKSVTATDTVTVNVQEKQEPIKEYSQKAYDPKEYVAWDVVGAYDKDTGKPAEGMDNASNYIESVTMAGKEVVWGESDDDYPRYTDDKEYPTHQMPNNPVSMGVRVGKTLSTYFGKDLTSSDPSKSVTLTIKPKAGYYVSGFWIVCCGGGANGWYGSTPYDCKVMEYDNEHRATFEFSDTAGGTVTATVESKHFGHNAMANDQNFILISVAPIPTPLFVEYDYGEIKDRVADADKAIFTTPTSWTTTSNQNVYGTTGKVDTQNTQYRYAYQSGKPTDSANWKHYANTVTGQAKTAAANAGYYFAGWKAEYYTDAKAESVTNDPDGKNYNYNLSDHYSAEKTYAEGDKVDLLMHVKLTAQWKPIQLKVTKQVVGLDEINEHKGKEQTYVLTLQKLNADGSTYTNVKTTGYIITGDGVVSYIFGADVVDPTLELAITPGTYKVVETGNYNISGTSTNAYCTVSYPVETVVVTADGTVKELKVFNTYSSEPATTTVTIEKQVTGFMGDPTKDFNFTVGFTGDSDCITAHKGEGTISVDWTKGFTLKDNESITFENVPIGAIVTVTETGAADYKVTSDVDSKVYAADRDGENTDAVFTYKVENATTTENPNKIVVTNNKTILPDAGIDLGSVTPYLFLLCVGAVGVATLKRKRER